MKIGVNALGTIYQRAGGRIYYKNIIQNLARIDNENTYIIFLSSPRGDIFEVEQKNFVKVICSKFADRNDLSQTPK